jgi:hypothetical protein
MLEHEPLQFDLVEVSGTNQYKVKPLELVSTVVPPMVVVFKVLLLAAAGDPVFVVPVPAPLFEPPELPHAAITSVAATSPAGASHPLFIGSLRSAGKPVI